MFNFPILSLFIYYHTFEYEYVLTFFLTLQKENCLMSEVYKNITEMFMVVQMVLLISSGY